MKIFAIDTKTEECTEIKDLYWFEENFVHDFGSDGADYRFEFQIENGDKLIAVIDRFSFTPLAIDLDGTKWHTDAAGMPTEKADD